MGGGSARKGSSNEFGIGNRSDFVGFGLMDLGAAGGGVFWRFDECLPSWWGRNRCTGAWERQDTQVRAKPVITNHCPRRNHLRPIKMRIDPLFGTPSANLALHVMDSPDRLHNFHFVHTTILVHT